MKIKVMLVSKQAAVFAGLEQMLQDEELIIAAESPGGAAALETVENVAPDVLILRMGHEDTDVLNLSERIVQHKPRTFVILLAETLTEEILKSATGVGVHNIIAMPSSSKEFIEYVKTVYHSETSRINALNENQRAAWTSKVITVYGAKGGQGKTTIATNLAVSLAGHGKKVALLDFDLQFGDVPVFMDITPKDTIAELVQDVFTPTIDSIRSYMVVHPSGVHVLCAPKSPEYAEVVTAEQVQRLLSLLRSYYDYVIIDTAPSFNDVTLSAIEASSMVLFVTGLDVSMLKNSKLSVGVLESLQQKGKVRLVINRAVEFHTITIADVQRILDVPIMAVIPSDYSVAVSALNRGVPFVQGAPRSKLSMAIADITGLLIAGANNYDIQRLTPKERKALLKKYKSKEKPEKNPFWHFHKK